MAEPTAARMMTPATKTCTRKRACVERRLMARATTAESDAHSNTAAGPSAGIARETLTDSASARRSRSAFISSYDTGELRDRGARADASGVRVGYKSSGLSGRGL